MGLIGSGNNDSNANNDKWIRKFLTAGLFSAVQRTLTLDPSIVEVSVLLQDSIPWGKTISPRPFVRKALASLVPPS